MRFAVIDVFADSAYRGNALAVFTDAADLSGDQMQAIASELALSETVFVTSVEDPVYDVRIFTPATEVPFAGHPTIGAAWTLRAEGSLGDGPFLQRSGGGDTPVVLQEGFLFFERTGTVEPDLASEELPILAEALGLSVSDLSVSARFFGSDRTLAPAHADAGLRQLHVPVRDVEALSRIEVDPARLLGVTPLGAHCFTAHGETLRSRALLPGLGIPEDPATGSAAAGLGLLLADRIGEVRCEIVQAVEMGRSSQLFVEAAPGRVRVGGACAPVLEGTLRSLP